METKPKRGRGRPRKSESINTEEKKTKTTTKRSKKKKQSEIILQIPITMKDVSQFKGNTDSSSDKTTKNIFAPKESSTEHHDNNIFTLTDVSNSSSERYNAFDPNSKTLVKKLQEKERVINNLKNELKEFKGTVNFYSGRDKIVIPMDLNLVDAEDGKTVVVDNTDKCCWWDHHSFNNTPCFIPEKFQNNKYFVFGCFCSYSCAAAYNVNTINDYKVSDRYSLMKQLYNIIFANTNDINIASSWLILKKYGGHMSIEEFRLSNKKGARDYVVTIPPLFYTAPTITSESKDKMVHSKNNNSSDSDNLVLKRSKPLPRAKNTLMETMGLTIEKKMKQ